MQINEICEKLVYFHDMLGQWLYIYDRFGENAKIGKPRVVCCETVAKVLQILRSDEVTYLIQSGVPSVNHISYLSGLISRMVKNFNEVTQSVPSSLAMIKLANVHTQLGFLINCFKYPGWC